MKCPSLFSDHSEVCSEGDSTLTLQVAHNSNVIIPVHFTSSRINTSSISKFKFPIRPPEPNRVQDKRSTLQIFQDMIGILGDTPKVNYKFYMDLLLKRESGLQEINENGVELSTELIKKAITEFSPTLAKMKADYLRDLSSDIVTQHVKLSLPDPGAATQGPLLFLEATVPDSHLPLHSIPLLADTGATNSCISISTLLTLGLSKNDICTEVHYLLTNVTESENFMSMVLVDLRVVNNSCTIVFGI